MGFNSGFKGLIVVASGMGHAVAQLIEALRYKAEDRWFDSRWCH